MKSKILIPFLAVLFLAISCDIYKQDEFQEQYMVESYLIANRTLPQVRVTRVVEIDEEYALEDASVNNANVQIELLNQDSSVVQSFSYEQEQGAEGVYMPVGTHNVLPLRRYRLRVEISNSDNEITATTLVPGEFEQVGNVVESIAYQDPRQIVITTERSVYPDRQAFFIFNVNTLRPDEIYLTPFYADLVNEQDEDIEDFFSNSSGIINEENYEQNEDGTLTLRVPWLAVAFYGENNIISNAIDDNLYDFYRSIEVQGGGGTLPPGELQNVIYNVEGGIGVFGSMATDTVTVDILENN